MKTRMYLVGIIFLSLIYGTVVAQSNLAKNLYADYPDFKEKIVENKRFSYEDLQKVIDKYRDSKLFNIQDAGKSLEGREIKLIHFGTGPVKIFAWSQMHGDESTATMALMDILKFFNSDDSYNNYRNDLLSKVTIYLLPMLNPDGAENFTRRNALNIDLNRDALRLQFPESKILRAVQDSIKPKFAFNLHDQSTRYSSGYTYKAATISFLAPAYNYEKDINEVRANTMKLIVNLFDELSQFIPGHIARYDDEFEPRAFGDNFVKWGSSSVLIESGGWKNNYEKQFLRKMNFIALLSGFKSIAEEKYKDADIKRYNEIPENRKRLFDLLLKNVTFDFNGNSYVIDIGINQNEMGTSDERDFYFKGTIEDIGDLSTFYGYDQIDCGGLKIIPAKIYPEIITTEDKLKKIDLDELYSNGVTSIMVDSILSDENYTNLSINILSVNSKYKSEIGIDKIADFALTDGDKIKFLVINGFLYDLTSGKNYIQNGLIIR